MWILGGTLPPVRLSVLRISVDPVRLPRSRPPLNMLGGGEWWVGRERIVGIMIVIVIERTGLGSVTRDGSRTSDARAHPMVRTSLSRPRLNLSNELVTSYDESYKR